MTFTIQTGTRVRKVMSLSACDPGSPVEPVVRANDAKRVRAETPPEPDGTCRSGWIVAGRNGETVCVTAE
jgi:hypothetical protein